MKRVTEWRAEMREMWNQDGEGKALVVAILFTSTMMAAMVVGMAVFLVAAAITHPVIAAVVGAGIWTFAQIVLWVVGPPDVDS